MKSLFPEKKSKNILIIIPTKSVQSHFLPFITDTIPDLHVLFNSVCFPLYVYDSEKNKKILNVTETALQEYQNFYNNEKITKEDIFYYVYGLLHHKGYGEKYYSNLAKEYPHIPMAPKFWDFSKAGKKLALIHLNYEYGKKYNLGDPKNNKFRKLMKISFGRMVLNNMKTSDQTKIYINGILVFENIPKINYRVSGRTPLEWVVDKFKISENKDSGIVNDPGDIDIISIIERVVYVGIESDKIIKELPKEFEPINWSPKKTGLEQFV